MIRTNIKKSESLEIKKKTFQEQINQIINNDTEITDKYIYFYYKEKSPKLLSIRSIKDLNLNRKIILEKDIKINCEMSLNPMLNFCENKISLEKTIFYTWNNLDNTKESEVMIEWK